MLVPSPNGPIEVQTWNARFVDYDNDLMSGFVVEKPGNRHFIPFMSADFRRVLQETRREAEDGTFYRTTEYGSGVNFDVAPHSFIAEKLGRMAADAAEQMAREAAYGVLEPYSQLRVLSEIVADPATGHDTRSEAEGFIDRILDTMPRPDIAPSEPGPTIS